MPEIKDKNVVIALDMHGCPNRCRHCWLGQASQGTMTEEDLRWSVSQFRSVVRLGQTRPFFDKLTVSSSFREPDYSDDYRILYELGRELSDGPPIRFELLSIWRLARDPTYAKWAKQVGPDTCQISFFGLEETNDWFHRRRGAFRDGLTATERLLEAGMKPRWQFFFTKKIVPEINDLFKWVDKLRLRERVAALGGEFTFFLHVPGTEGEGRNLESLVPTLEDTAAIPIEIVEASRKHFKAETPWITEAERIAQIEGQEDHFPSAYSYPEKLWFLIKNNWDVFTNTGTLEPWWKLGNLKMDPVETILTRFENNTPLGLKTIYTVSRKELARRFGHRDSQWLDSELEACWTEKYCEQVRNGGF